MSYDVNVQNAFGLALVVAAVAEWTFVVVMFGRVLGG